MEKMLLFLVILMLFILVRVLKQDFLSPAVINACWNTFFIAGAVLIFDDGMDWNYEGIFWMLASCYVCLAGQAMGTAVHFEKIKSAVAGKRNYLNLILIGIILLGMLQPFVYLNGFGYSVTDIFRVDQLLQLNEEIAYDRYYGHTFQVPVISSILTIIIYLGSCIGGYTFLIAKGLLGKILSLATILPVLFLAIVTNGKVGVIACVFLWGIGWLVYSLNQKRTGKLLSKRLIGIGAAVAVLGIAFLDLTMLLRIGSIDMETQRIVNHKLQEYAFGHIQAFSAWFHKGEFTDLELGSNTYMFFTNWLGLTVRKAGVYELMEGASSNIFTQNRGIIMDFGVLGGLVYWMLIGVVSGMAYKKVKSGSNYCIGSTTVLSALYFMILYGFIISPWIYSSYVLAFAGFAVFLVVLKNLRVSFQR